MSSNNDNSWVVEVVPFNLLGICSDEILENAFENYARFEVANFPEGYFLARVSSNAYITNEDGTTGEQYVQHTIRYLIGDVFLNHVRQINNIPDDVELIPSGLSISPVDYWQHGQWRFNTQEEAQEFIDSDYEIDPIATINDGDDLYSCYREGETDGHSWRQYYYLRYSGDTIKLYTYKDWINFWITILGTDSNPFPFDVYIYESFGNDPLFIYDEEEVTNYWPSDDCTIGFNSKITELPNGSVQTSVSVDYNPSIPDPTSTTVTVVTVDGDPPLTSLENGDGSVTISDDGNINMSNDGGSFYLNEFGHSGMYANGDVSLTAGQTAQLGVGSHSISVVSDGFIFQQGGEMLKVSFDRIKEVLGE